MMVLAKVGVLDIQLVEAMDACLGRWKAVLMERRMVKMWVEKLAEYLGHLAVELTDVLMGIQSVALTD